MNEITKTIADQINAKELHFAKFKLMNDDKTNTIYVNKGVKTIQIKYDEGSDTYILTKLKKGEVVDVLENTYFEDLQNIISEFFKFEYVMERLFASNHEGESMLNAAKNNDKEMMDRLEEKAKNGEQIRIT